MMPSRKPFLSLALALLLISLMLPGRLLAENKGSKASEAKKTGFSGDPAKKRGLEIGYDLGRKAGKADLEQKLKPDPKRHEDYNKPEKYFRHEYGSQASFTSGFRSGFVGGYQAAFGKKVPLSASGTTTDKTKANGTTGTPAKKTSGGGSSSDAL
ncbi:MAG: hypothetical protein U1F66_07935 [bacterium]